MIQQSYLNIRNNKFVLIMVILTRFLIGFSFIPSGLKKILGDPFTGLGPESPVGFFFDALQRTGIYYQFIGCAQLITAFLLMSQRYAILGATFFFFLIINIWVITISLHFSGTWIITSLLLIADIILLAWDYQKLMPIFFPGCTDKNIPLLTHHRSWNFLALILIFLSVGISLIFESGPVSSIIKYGWLLMVSITVLYGIYKQLSDVKKYL